MYRKVIFCFAEAEVLKKLQNADQKTHKNLIRAIWFCFYVRYTRLIDDLYVCV